MYHHWLCHGYAPRDEPPGPQTLVGAAMESRQPRGFVEDHLSTMLSYVIHQEYDFKAQKTLIQPLERTFTPQKAGTQPCQNWNWFQFSIFLAVEVQGTALHHARPNRIIYEALNRCFMNFDIFFRMGDGP